MRPSLPPPSEVSRAWPPLFTSLAPALPPASPLRLPLLVSSRLPRARHRPRRTPARTRACKRRPPYGRTAARLARPRIPGHSALREERAISLPERSAGVGTDEGDFERRPARGTPERGTLRGRARGPCLLGHAVQRPGRLRRASAPRLSQSRHFRAAACAPRGRPPPTGRGAPQAHTKLVEVCSTFGNSSMFIYVHGTSNIFYIHFVLMDI